VFSKQSKAKRSLDEGAGRSLYYLVNKMAEKRQRTSVAWNHFDLDEMTNKVT